MYLGMTLLFAGLGLSLERLGLVLRGARRGGSIVDRFVIPREERHLESRFGESYRDYKRRVRRWL
jgi:protein-S-isoprenylcysteine O-methyltransferase Ste14